MTGSYPFGSDNNLKSKNNPSPFSFGCKPHSENQNHSVYFSITHTNIYIYNSCAIIVWCVLVLCDETIHPVGGEIIIR